MTVAAFRSSCYHTIKYASSTFLILHYIHQYVACSLPKIAGCPTASCAILQYGSQYVFCFFCFFPSDPNVTSAEQLRAQTDDASLHYKLRRMYEQEGSERQSTTSKLYVICMQLFRQCMDGYHTEEYSVWNSAHFSKWSFTKGS